MIRSSINLPEGERLASGSTFRHALAVSPDGRWVAYASYKPGEGDENGNEVLEMGAHRRGMLEELEKAHIYIEQLHQRLKEVEERVRQLEK